MTILKAIRDKAPITRGLVKQVDDLTFTCLLASKLHEEAEEVARDPSDINEYADVLEVLLELAARNGITPEAIEKARIAKRRERGGFQTNRAFFTPLPKRKATIGHSGERVPFKGVEPAVTNGQPTGCTHGSDSDHCPDCRH